MAIVSQTAKYHVLTMQTPFNVAGEPEKYYPDFPRNFAGVVPTMTSKARRGPASPKQLGVRNVRVVRRQHLWPGNSRPADYNDVAERVRHASPDLVYVGGIDTNCPGNLW